MSNKQWKVTEFKGFDYLKRSDAQVPKPGAGEVLVQHKAASLNYRDLIIAKGMYDAAGQVVAVGPDVQDFKKGDRVSGNFNLKHFGGPLTPKAIGSGLGGAVDGVLQSYRLYHEDSLLKVPDYMSYEEAATLPCAALTAYNALYGAPEHSLKPGQWVLTQGTGGVSIFALQLAKAAGARVVATTSSEEKVQILKKLGADVVLNYKTTTEWGAPAKKATGGVGVDIAVEVGGPGTMKQTLEALKPGGIITIIGFVGKSDQPEPTVSSLLRYRATARAILVGPVEMFKDMNKGLEVSQLKPVIDKVFPFEQTKEAYEYMWAQKHVGKVVIKYD